MNFKKIMLITLLLLAVLTIGSVSATEDVDAFAVDDVGDETVVEALVDEDATQTAVADEDVVEAEENTDTLASPSVSFYDKVDSEYGSVCFFSEYSNGINGNVSLFANETHAYEQEITGKDYILINANHLVGSFYGTYNMKLIYNGTDGTNYEKEGTVTFTKAIINKVFTPDDFKVTFLTNEIDINKGDSVIITYFCPEGIKERSSSLYVYYDVGEYDYRPINMELADVGTYKNITWEDLYIYKTGVYNLKVRYSEDQEKFLELGNTTINVTDNHEYTAEDFITIYGRVDTGAEDCLAEIYDKEVEGLNGVVTAYANTTQIYTKTYSNYNAGGPIHAKDLTGSLNGVYTVKIEYKRADGKVFDLSKNVYFDNVGGSEPVTPDTRPWIDFVVEASDIRFGDELLVTFTEENNIPFTGKVGVRIYESGSVLPIKSIVVDANNGAGSARFSDLPVGNFKVDVYSNETDSYKAGYGYKEFTVKKAWSTILFYDSIVDLDVNTPFNLTVDFEKATGIAAKVDGENVTVNGNEILIPALSMGTHTLVISTIPDDNHIEDSREVTLNVTKPKSSIVLDGKFSFDKGSSTNITVTTKNAIDFNASIEGHPEALSRNGNVITISGLGVGSYTLTVTTIVDDDHLAVTEKATIKVNQLIATIEFSDDKIVFEEGSSGSIMVNVSNGSINKDKVLVIAHKEAVIKIEGNKITVFNLTSGNYRLSVTSKPNTGYSANGKSVDVVVNPKTEVKANSSISVSDVVLDYGSSKNVPVETVGAVGFTAKIDGVDASVSGNSVVVSGLSVGTHTLSVTTIPAEGYNEATVNVTITVNKATPSLTVSPSSLSTVYNGGKYFVATLKGVDGAINGVYISTNIKTLKAAKTVNGQVKWSTNGLVPTKTYTVVLTFAGNANYAKVTKKITVKVSKATPKLTAKAKTFKRADKKKLYTVTLKTNQNKVMKNTKVTITVNKKTYTAYTNAKGQATFKLTKLTKKGKYSAVVKYGGNSYYKAVTSKPKITVK